MDIRFQQGGLTSSQQAVITEGFRTHAVHRQAPPYQAQNLSWVASDEHNEIAAALAGEIVWDWVFVDELWVAPDHRGLGLGSKLLTSAEEFAKEQALQGIWLWTQSWEAEDFYPKLGYSEFTRFENFPKGHTRIGYRKSLV
ncbi:GNAT family N-acetyltransferase [Congregibacter variabilis]|uniref:GNAT family N-acetyltransferase n=1 Tax=Congregibacter variabilis TaxID=3081200 RepID=A0ABZ0I1B4_9GAMM|nr:GNAT family N-acetyltransferase [Congregibacter sp. IMCC43200]